MDRILRALGAFLLTTVAAPVAVGVTVLASFLYLPLPAALPTPRPGVESQISHVYDDQGNQIAVFRAFETSIPVSRGDIPAVLKQAVVAAEDRRFYKHGGVDVKATLRALWADFRHQGYVQGGSTITQQYVKNAYIGKERTVLRKAREAVLASQLNRKVSKNEILYRYLSTIYLGDGLYGVGAASESYFHKSVRDLTLSEAALLAGLIPAPSRFAPRGNPTDAEANRKRVLQEMFKQHLITFPQLAGADSQGLWFAASGRPPQPATLVYPPEADKGQFPYFVDYVRRYLVAKYGPTMVFRGGLKVETTIDPAMQAAAEKSIAGALSGTTSPLDMSLVAVEPHTGYVKALVGGRDFNASQVNLALGSLGGGTGRQPGSSFKPFVLARAFEEGISPSRVYPAPNQYHIPHCVGPADQCTIRNYEGASFGSATLQTATWKSINTVYAQLTRDVGVPDVAEMAHRLGISTSLYDPKRYGISIGLGAQEVSPLDMASAYSVFANRGQRVEPTPVLKVTDARGHVLEDHTSPQLSRVLSEIVSDNVTAVLRGVITSGTGRAADIGRPAAGKTGTAQEWRDAWFVGYTPALSTAIWMGDADKPRPLLGIKGVSHVAGGTIPAKTWHDFMTQALKDIPVTDFSQPAPIQPIADEARRLERGGFDLGGRRYVAGTPADCDGPCQTGELAPEPQVPESTTTTTSPLGESTGSPPTTGPLPVRPP